jgi:hypothetical protein
MSERYEGTEPCTSFSQVVRYLMENYADTEGTPMPRATALAIVEGGHEQITKGIEVFRSNVYFLGDEALKTVPQAWVFLPEDDS